MPQRSSPNFTALRWSGWPPYEREYARCPPYPSKSDRILDKPIADSGGNFGRLARTGMMDAYMKKLNEVRLCGIKAVFWREFLKTFREGATDTQARTALERLKQRVQQATDMPSPKAQSTLAIVGELESLLNLTE